jgi:hypothetical protein
MKIVFRLVPIQIFGWCVNSDPSFFNHMINSVKNGESIVQESVRKVDENDVYAYLFYDSFNPPTLAKAFIGKVKLKGTYPEPTAPYGYIFNPNNDLQIKALLVDETEAGPDYVILDHKLLK